MQGVEGGASGKPLVAGGIESVLMNCRRRTRRGRAGATGMWTGWFTHQHGIQLLVKDHARVVLDWPYRVKVSIEQW